MERAVRHDKRVERAARDDERRAADDGPVRAATRGARVAGCRRSWPLPPYSRHCPCVRPSAYRSAAAPTRDRAGPCATAVESTSPASLLPLPSPLSLARSFPLACIVLVVIVSQGYPYRPIATIKTRQLAASPPSFAAARAQFYL
uniref:Uncharacterized protein n=1 Tax=Plectus sambesii TaxID=2011161 RepID=A0A914XNB5_9BILA